MNKIYADDTQSFSSARWLKVFVVHAESWKNEKKLSVNVFYKSVTQSFTVSLPDMNTLIFISSQNNSTMMG